MDRLHRRGFLRMGLAGTAGAVLPLSLAEALPLQRTQSDRLNVLFIAVDDLRPQLGCYGSRTALSPHIDQLAEQGVLFQRAYCQQAVCNASRSSLMTGLRPDTTRVTDNQTRFRDTVPDAVTIPQQFRLHGYHAAAFGKIYHGGGIFNDALSWSEPAWFPRKPPFLTPEGQARVAQENRTEFKGIPYEAPDVPDNALKDGDTADAVVAALERFQDRPFFLAAGFLKPHLPFVAPKRYWDLYNPENFPLADNPDSPEGAPACALHKSEELRNYIGIPPEGSIPEALARTLIHGYHACVSYTDAQIGRVLAALDRLNLRERTIVILWGDHGWQLGEHGLWTKHTNFEIATRSPLIISVPGMRAKNATTDALVEFVDIHPSLCKLCGVPLPEGLEGFSFAPLLDTPRRPWKKAAFSQFPHNVPDIGTSMGHSMRTVRYRLTEWTVPGTDFRKLELYDHVADPDENVCLAQRPEYAELMKRLLAQLHAGWKAALPEG